MTCPVGAAHEPQNQPQYYGVHKRRRRATKKATADVTIATRRTTDRPTEKIHGVGENAEATA